MIGRVAGLLLLVITALGQTELPESDDYESFEVEPPALLPPDPDKGEGKAAAQSGEAGRDPAELEKKLERAKRTAAEAEQLYKRGVLSRMEVESRMLRIVRVQSDLETARHESAKADLVVQQTRQQKGEISKDELVASEREVEAARKTAETAAATRERAEIAAAETNLRRQQKLAKLGSARPSDVAKAEQKLADLKAKN